MNSWLKNVLKEVVSLTDEEWAFFIQFGKTVKLKPNDTFFTSGVVADKIGFLKEGILRAYHTNDYGKIITCYFYHLPKNNIVSLHTSFTQNSPSEHTVEAITECEILYLEKQNLQSCLERFSVFERLVRIIAENEYLKSSKRINDLQTKPAKEIYRTFLRESGDLVLKVPQHMIASYLGMSQYTLSKIKKEI